MLRDDARFLELLDRWLTGEFTRADERELQALAAADPFRREAWEGFVALPETEHAAVLERLRTRLNPQSRKRVPLGVWLAAAATVALLLVAVLFLPKPESRLASPLAKTQEMQTEAQKPQLDTSDSPLAFEPGISDAELPSTSRRSSSAAGKGIVSSVMQPDAEVATIAAADESPEEVKILALPPQPTGLAKAEKAKAQPQDAGQVEQVRNVPPAAPGQIAQNNSLSIDSASDKATKELLERNRAAAQEKQSQPARKAAPAAAEPAGGWDKFHAFLRQNARLTDAARNNNVSGRVRLEFNIGPDGKPANVRVTQSLGHGCDEEAMRLIRLFYWTPAGADPVVVEVPFVR